MTGFKIATVPEINLAEGDRPNLDLRMELGPLEQPVKVLAQTPALEIETSGLGALFDQQAIDDPLPNQGCPI